MSFDTRMNPGGRGEIKSRYVNGKLIFYHPTSGAELFRIDPAVTGGYVIPGGVRHIRTRFTLAQVNAGATLLAALTGFKYRMITASAIAVGGAAGALDTFDILGTQSTSKKLVAFAQAGLTRSTVLTAGDSSSAVLADGASYVACDVSTAITIGKTGASLTTATHIDVSFTYVLEP